MGCAPVPTSTPEVAGLVTAREELGDGSFRISLEGSRSHMVDTHAERGIIGGGVPDVGDLLLAGTTPTPWVARLVSHDGCFGSGEMGPKKTATSRWTADSACRRRPTSTVLTAGSRSTSSTAQGSVWTDRGRSPPSSSGCWAKAVIEGRELMRVPNSTSNSHIGRYCRHQRRTADKYARCCVRRKPEPAVLKTKVDIAAELTLAVEDRPASTYARTCSARSQHRLPRHGGTRA